LRNTETKIEFPSLQRTSRVYLMLFCEDT